MLSWLSALSALKWFKIQTLYTVGCIILRGKLHILPNPIRHVNKQVKEIYILLTQPVKPVMSNT